MVRKRADILLSLAHPDFYRLHRLPRPVDDQRYPPGVQLGLGNRIRLHCQQIPSKNAVALFYEWYLCNLHRLDCLRGPLRNIQRRWIAKSGRRKGSSWLDIHVQLLLQQWMAYITGCL